MGLVSVDIRILTVFLLLLFFLFSSGCGGVSPSTADLPAAPVATATVWGTKGLLFQWTQVPQAHHYRLGLDFDGLSGFTTVPSGSPLFTSTHLLEVAIHRTNWLEGLFVVDACNEDEQLCLPSNQIVLTRAMSALATGYVKAPNVDSEDWFGYASALSGDGMTLAVGAFGEGSDSNTINGQSSDNSAKAAGAVYVYTKVNNEWLFQAYIKASNSDASDVFGLTLDLSDDGNTLVVGAFGEGSSAKGVNGLQEDEGAPISGAAYVFTRLGTVWSQEAYIKASNTGPGDLFGVALTISDDGNILAIGAQYEGSSATGINGNQDDDSELASGAVYIYERAGSTWSQQAYVKASDTAAANYFGCSLSLDADGSTLAVGAYGGGDMDSSGAVYLFARNGTTWSQEQRLINALGAEDDNFGRTVELSDDGLTLAVGAAWEDDAAAGLVNCGAAYLFSKGGGSWHEVAALKGPNASAQDNFAMSLALSGDGGTLAIGSTGEDSDVTGVGPLHDDESSSESGAVYVYTLVDEQWKLVNCVKASNTGSGDQFGSSLSLSDNGMTLAVGSYGEESNGSPDDDSLPDAGAVYLY